MKKYFSGILVMFLICSAAYEQLNGMEESTLTRSDSMARLSPYFDNQGNQFHIFSPQEYLQLAEQFVKGQGLLYQEKLSDGGIPFLKMSDIQNMHNEYDQIVGYLRKLGKIFGFKRYADIYSPAFLKIISVDSRGASWSELMKIAENHSAIQTLISKFSNELKTTGIPSENDVDLFIEATVGRQQGAFFDVSQLSPESEQIFRATLKRVFFSTKAIIGTSEGNLTGTDIFLKAVLLFTRGILPEDNADYPKWFSSIAQTSSIMVPEIISIDVSFPNFKRRVIENNDNYKKAIETPITTDNTPLTVGHLKWLYNTRFAAQIAQIERRNGASSSNESGLSDEDIEFLVNITVGNSSKSLFGILDRLFDLSETSDRLMTAFFQGLKLCMSDSVESELKDTLLPGEKSRSTKNIYKLMDEYDGVFRRLFGYDDIQSLVSGERQRDLSIFLQNFIKTLKYSKKLSCILDTIQYDDDGDIIWNKSIGDQIRDALNSDDFYDSTLPSDLVEFAIELKQRIKDVLFPNNSNEIFKSILRNALRNSTGFQRIMSLLGCNLVNLDPQRPFWCNDFYSIKIHFSYKSSKIFPENNIIVLNIDDRNSKSSKLNEAFFVHELSHAYHYKINCKIPKGNWFVNYSIMNSAAINFINQFFPFFNNKNICFSLAGGKNGFVDKLVGTASDTIKFGFGNFLFDSENYNPTIMNNEHFFLRCKYMENYILPGSSDEKDNFWTTGEEMLTMQGIVPFLINEKYVILEDRQNEHIFCVRRDANISEAEEELENNTYRFHNKIADDWRWIDSDVDDLDFEDLKIDLHIQGTKFGEINGSEVESYKTEANVIPVDLSYFSDNGRDIASHAFPEDLNLFITDINNNRVNIKICTNPYESAIQYSRDPIARAIQLKEHINKLKYYNNSVETIAMAIQMVSDQPNLVEILLKFILRLPQSMRNSIVYKTLEEESGTYPSDLIDIILNADDIDLGLCLKGMLNTSCGVSRNKSHLENIRRIIEKMSQDGIFRDVISVLWGKTSSAYDPIYIELNKIKPDWYDDVLSFHNIHLAPPKINFYDGRLRIDHPGLIIEEDRSGSLRFILKYENNLPKNEKLLEDLTNPKSKIRLYIADYVNAQMDNYKKYYPIEYSNHSPEDSEELFFKKLEAVIKRMDGMSGCDMLKKLKNLIQNAYKLKDQQ